MVKTSKRKSAPTSFSLEKDAVDRLFELMLKNNDTRSAIVNQLILASPDVLPDYLYKLVDEPLMIQGNPWFGLLTGVVRVKKEPRGEDSIRISSLDVVVTDMSFEDFVRYITQFRWPN